MIPDLEAKKLKMENAQRLNACWRAFCEVFLANKQSFLFDYDKPILTRAALDDIKREFCDKPILENENNDFFIKLEQQSEGFSKEAKLCFMHIYFLHLLIISKAREGKKGGMRPDTKRERLLFFEKDTGPFSGKFLSKFDNVFESGVCNPGHHYNTTQFVNCDFMVKMFINKKFYEKQDDYAAIIEKYCTANENATKAYGISSALRFYAMPKKYQTIISRNAKDNIVKSFHKSLGISFNDEQTRDEKLLIIKKRLEQKYPGDIVDFYYSPYKEQWRGVDTVKEPRANYHPDNQQEDKDMNQRTPLNQILFGPPGTGKTYSAISLAVAIAMGQEQDWESWKSQEKEEERLEKLNTLMQRGQIQMVTFHQNYAYEDFIEGIKPKLDDGNGDLSYELKDGIFKMLSVKADQAPSQQVSEEERINQLILNFAEEIKRKLAAEGKVPFTDTTEIQKVGSGTNGAFFGFGKKGNSNNLRFDIIAKIYPHVESGKFQRGNDVQTIQRTNHHYYFAICKMIEKFNENSLNQNRQNHVLIIDEINRGNIAKIFGELITLIEESKRLGEKEGMTLTLPYSQNKFGVPNNLYIIGTMNTADRSIALLDTALRRRFKFTEMMPDITLLSSIEQGTISLPDLLTAINERIIALHDREHQIGHSYLMGVENIEGLKATFQQNIIPLLQEYFFDDWDRIVKVLNDNGFITQDDTEHGVIYSVLSHDDKKWDDPNRYIAIYERRNDSENKDD